MTGRRSSADDGGFAGARRVNISVMSWVVNVVLSFDIEDLDTADEFNHRLAVDAPDREHSRRRGVGLLGDLVGDEAPAWRGAKYPSADCGAGPLTTPIWIRSSPNSRPCRGRARRGTAARAGPGTDLFPAMDDPQRQSWSVRDRHHLTTTPRGDLAKKTR